MVIPTNPYIAGAPLRGQSGFFGRQDVLEWVERELRNPNTNALVLFGQRRIGKTTLLLQLQRTLPDEAFLPVYFDLQDQARRTLDTVLADLADTVAEQAGMSPPDAKAFNDNGRYFRTTFLPDLYATLDGRRPVLLLDEFDVLDQTAERELPESAATKALFPFLRRLMLEEPALAFVFVVGRRAEDLTLDFSATFKASLTREVWALDRNSAVNLIRQAEQAGTLTFSDEAIKRVLQLSSGHPYLIQLLCQRIWEQAHDKESDNVPLIDQAFVEAAVPNSLEAGYQAFAWLWDGLSPAEKIYTAAFAEATDEGGTIAEDEVIRILATHAARLRTQEVEMAPLDLVRRRVLAEVGDHVYSFNIELFRRWIRAYKPLREVKDELDQIDPLADQTFEVGRSFYIRRKWDVAVRYFRDALLANPRHLKARLFLGEALLSLGEIDQAVHELEEAYAQDRDEARLPLARALIANAKVELDQGNEDAALDFLNRALELSPQEHEALDIQADIWTARGDLALEEEDLQAALEAFERAGNSQKSGQVRSLMQLRALAALEDEAHAYEGHAQWAQAARVYEQLLAQDADEERKAGWQRSLDRVAAEVELSRLFDEGLNHLEREEWGQAQEVFAEIVHRRPGYSKDGQTAIRLLEKAVRVGELQPVWRRPFNWAIAFSGAVVLLLVLWAVFQAGGRFLNDQSTLPGTATASVSAAAIAEPSPTGTTAVANEPSAAQSEQVQAATATRTASATLSSSITVPHTPTVESQASEEAAALLESYGASLNAGNITEALAFVNQAIEIDPSHTSAFVERGHLYRDYLDDHESALSDFARAIELEPDLAWAYYERARVYHNQGNYEAAYEDINRAIALDPNVASYFNLRGDLHGNFWQLHEAVADYSRSIELDPDNAYAYAKRAEIYSHHHNELDKALVDFNRAIELDPTHWMYSYRANLHAKLGQVEEARSDFDQAIALATVPEDISAIHRYAGDIYFHELDDPQTALSEYNDAIILDPNNAAAYLGRGSNYYFNYAKDNDAALEDIDRAIELDPNIPQNFEYRGNVHVAMGDTDSAIADWQRCLEVDPQFYWCHRELGQLYEGLGDVESAVSHYWDFLTLVPEFECRDLDSDCQVEAVDYIRSIMPGQMELFADGFSGMIDIGMAFDEDRNLYVADEGSFGNDRSVVKVTRDGHLSTVVSGLAGASGLAFNSHGSLHVADFNGQVYQIYESGDLIPFGDALKVSTLPSAIAFDNEDYLYVVNCGQQENVAILDPEGILVNPQLAAGMNCPKDIVIDDKAGVLYVSDRDGNIIQIDKVTGNHTTYASTNSRTEGGLAADEQGNLYFSSFETDQVLRIDAEDQSISACLDGIATPLALAFDSRGILYVAAHAAGEIYRAIGCQPQN